jgi:hypothetical protein
MVTPKERDTYTACRYLVPWQRIAKHLRINSARVIFEKNHSQQQGERNLGRAHVRRKKNRRLLCFMALIHNILPIVRTVG